MFVRWLPLIAVLGGGCRRVVVPPDEAEVPDLAQIPPGPLGDAIRRGQTIVEHTYETLPDHTGAKLHCTSCHLKGGTVVGAGTWIGIAAAFPEYRSRSARVNTLADRINDCFERSLNGTPLDPGSDDMAAIEAYMSYLSTGQPHGTPYSGRGFPRITPPPTPDRERGRAVYTAKCLACHGADGQGLSPGKYVYPPLWGDASFNIGAGMARLDTAAAFIHGNMPLNAGGTLTPQEAYDVADFVIHQPRPDFSGKLADWPRGDKPRDARY